MLLDDSVELEYNDYSGSAEPLPLNLDIELSKIWIPSSLLPNRKKPINPNENKPFVLYTLEKPEKSECFSVYTDENPQHHESETSPDISSEISPRKLVNMNTDKLQVQLPSQDAIEWDIKLSINNKKEIFDLHQVSRDELDDSSREPQVTHNSTVRNAPVWAAIEDLTHRMAEILSEDEPLHTDWHHDDVIEANQVTTDSTLDSIPPSAKDSLEELYYSDEDQDHFDIEEYELGNLESDPPEKKHTCSLYTENSYGKEMPFDNFVNSLNKPEQVENKNDDTFSECFEEKPLTPFEKQKIAIDNELDGIETDELNRMETIVQSKDPEQKLLNIEEPSDDPIEKIAIDNELDEIETDELNRMETVVQSKDHEQNLLNIEVPSDDPTEKIVAFPIAYKRPPLQEQAIKTKQQKEKKKTKKSKITIPLEDLFQSKEVDKFKVHEVDEFYENLVRQGKCQPQNLETSIEGIPSQYTPKSLPNNEHEFPSLNVQSVFHTNLLLDSAQSFTQSTDSDLLSNCSKKSIRNEKEIDSKVPLNTIIIDNIPLNVSKENIENFIIGFGVLEKFTIEQHGRFQRATLQMDFSCEVDWIIDCINGSQPFGSCDKEVIKCYRLTTRS